MKVMKSKIAFLAVLLFLSACSAKVIGIYNLEVVKTVPKTFHIYLPDELKSLSEQEKETDQKLAAIIRQDLLSKELKESSIPDLYISYIINVHSSQEINQPSYSRYDYYRYYNYGYYDPSRLNTKTYKQGVVIIDIRNQENKLVWQGSKSFKLSSKKNSRDELNTIFQEIIASFNPQELRHANRP